MDAGGAVTRASVSVPGLTLTAAARTGVFWVLALAFLASNFTTNTVTVHLIPYPSDRGYSATLAAAMIGWMGAMQLPARLVFGPVVACFRHRIVTVAIFFFQAASLAQLAMLRRLPTLAPIVVMLGVANGMATLARATTTAEIFGPRHYWSISGAIALGANGATRGRRSPPRSCTWRSTATSPCSGSWPARWWSRGSACSSPPGGFVSNEVG